MAKSCPVRTVVQPSAEAPTAAPADINLILLLARQGCKSFSGMLTAQGADDVFMESIKEGLTVFCPSDDAVKSFAPSYKNLTAAGKTSLLLYHALASGAGSRNTLATEGAKKFDFTVKNDGDDVKIVTKLNSATITGTLIDKDPVAVYQMDEVGGCQRWHMQSYMIMCKWAVAGVVVENWISPKIGVAGVGWSPELKLEMEDGDW
ncbi:hypothetical protein ACS0TY_019929 [Phlomoides rotata]